MPSIKASKSGPSIGKRRGKNRGPITSRQASLTLRQTSLVPIRLHVERLPEGLFLATSEDVPGLVAQGRTLPETVAIAGDVARQLFDARCERSEELSEYTVLVEI
jgi:predicted RNase H-like HicB family nuclease